MFTYSKRTNNTYTVFGLYVDVLTQFFVSRLRFLFSSSVLKGSSISANGRRKIIRQ